MGIQLITNHFDEKSLFKLGKLIEDSRSNIEIPSDWWIKKIIMDANNVRN